MCDNPVTTIRNALLPNSSCATHTLAIRSTVVPATTLPLVAVSKCDFSDFEAADLQLKKNFEVGITL